MEKLKVLELFGETGTQTQALKNIGVEHTSTLCEIDKYASDVYNQLHGETPNLGDITKVDINSLKESDYDLITYSFPCQSVSICGKQEGLIKGSGTTSSLLWECEKIIKKVKPKYLLMENVKNLLSDKFKPQFELWLKILRDMGYKNYYDVLNAKDYGIPQNRERVFCVSILGEDNYFEFPQKQELKLRLKDMLEDNPNEKYYLKKEVQDKFIMKDSNKDDIVSCAMRGRYNENGNIEQQIELNSEQVANCITTAQKDSMVVETNKIIEMNKNAKHQQDLVQHEKGICRCIPAGTHGSTPHLLKTMVEEPKIDRIGGMYGQATRWGVYNKEGICPTIVASMGEGGGHVPMITSEPQIKEIGKLDIKAFECCRRVYGTEGISPTVTAMGGDHVHKIIENNEKQVERLSKQAYETLEENNCKDGDIINPFYKKITKDGICPTITTRPEGMKTANLIVVDETIKNNGEIINPLKGQTEQGWLFEQQVYDPKGIARTIKAGGGSGNIPKVIVADNVKPSVASNIEREKEQIANSNKEIYQLKCESGFQDNKVGLKVSPTVRATTDSTFALDNHFRIRKLTPRECWRLMGWKDEQFDKIKGISNAQLYKMAGNAIVINVLEAIFRQMFLVKYDKKDISISGEQLDLF